VFDQIPQPNLYTWNIIIHAYASSHNPTQSLLIFLQMLHQCEHFPDKFTFPFVLKAALGLKVFQVGRVFHGMVIKALLSRMYLFLIHLCISMVRVGIWIWLMSCL
jgi:pentatricopeptide repeat protein